MKFSQKLILFLIVLTFSCDVVIAQHVHEGDSITFDSERVARIMTALHSVAKKDSIIKAQRDALSKDVEDFTRLDSVIIQLMRERALADSTILYFEESAEDFAYAAEYYADRSNHYEDITISLIGGVLVGYISKDETIGLLTAGGFYIFQRFSIIRWSF